jgi:DNA mismatch endonuclease, patch repair protein
MTCEMAKTSTSKASSRSNPVPSSEAVRRRMQATARRDTPQERAVRSALHAIGLRFRVDCCLPGCRRRADILFSRQKIAVFIDGCFWHVCPRHGTWPSSNSRWWRSKLLGNVARDRDTDRHLRKLGWRVFRFWEHEDPQRASKIVARAVRRRSN